MQGWRISMEDAHTAVLDLLASAPSEAKNHSSRLSFFGVFDGHGGDKVALFTGEHIHNIISRQDTFKTGNYEQALKDGFLATDRAILNGTTHGSRGACAEGVHAADKSGLFSLFCRSQVRGRGIWLHRLRRPHYGR